MAFFSDFDVPWWVQGSRYPHLGPHAHAYQQDPHHLRQQYPSDYHPSRPSMHAQLWPEVLSNSHREPSRHVPAYYDTYPGRHPRPSYPRDPYEQYMHDDEPGLLGSGSTFSRRHDGRHRPVSHSHTGQAQLGRSDQHPGPHELHLEDLLGLRPTNRALNKPQGASRRAGSPTVWSVHSPAQHDSEVDEEDEDAQPLDLERDRLQQLKKRQQLQNLQLRQQLMQEQQQQALQEQKRHEALLEQELQAQRSLQRRRAAEHQLEQQQQEALLAALQQQRRRQQQKLREQEQRLAQQRQAEYQAELERRLQQTLEQLQKQHQIEAVRGPEVEEPEEVQFEAVRHALERQQAQRPQQRAQESQQTAQQVQAEKMAQRTQQAQHAELDRQQQTQQAARQAFAQAAQHAQQHEPHKQAQHAPQAQHAQQHPQKRSQQLPEAKLKVPMHAMRRPLTSDEAASRIQSHYKGYRMRSEKPMLTALGKANHKLAQIFSRLYQVESCITALQAKAQPKAQQGAAVKLRHHHGKCGSPEQLQKQLVELSELSMQVVLSMDELHSDRSEVRMVRKQVVKKALALMERIDNVRAGMLRSLLDASHPQDHATSQTPTHTPQRDQAQTTTPDAKQQTPTNQLQSAQESFKAAEGLAADTLPEQPSVKATEGLAADMRTYDSAEQQGISAPDSVAAGTPSDTQSKAQAEQINSANTSKGAEKSGSGNSKVQTGQADSANTSSGLKESGSGNAAESDTDGAAGNVASLAADTEAATDAFASLSDKEAIDVICSGVDAVMAEKTAKQENDEDGSVLVW